MILPQKFTIPVEGAGKGDWNDDTFWHYPWGKSVVHKGVDIFANSGTPVLSATDGILIYKGNIGRGGKVLLVLGPKWRLHYYAHLREFKAAKWDFIRSGEEIGEVGNTGNASNTPSHLHYSIMTLIPYVWLWDDDIQ